MNNLPSKFSSFTGQLVYILGIPVFFLGFMMLFKPALMTGFFEIRQGMLAFNVTMLMCIILGVMLISRLPMYFCRNITNVNWFTYVLWCLAEIVASGFFMALYVTLMYHKSVAYFTAVGFCIGYLTLVEIFAYTIITLLLYVLSPQPEHITEEASLVRFHDNTQKLKFIIAASALLYIEADENYIKIAYKEGDRVLTYSLRSSMKAIDSLMQKHGLIRCQRSYYINPQHIKALRRDKDGALYADLSVEGTKAIPISAMYQQAVSERL